MLGKYIYGITKNSDRNQTLKQDGLSTVGYQDLSAVVADVEYKDYYSLAKEEVVKILISHQQMIERIMKNLGTILPVKFGTMLKDEKEVNSVLEKGNSFLSGTLEMMKDKIEVDLVCFWNEEKAAQMAYQENKRIQKMQANLSKKGNVALEDKIALGKEIAKYLTSKREEISNHILEVLKKEAVKSCAHALVDVNMLLNKAFLVEKRNEEVFNRTLNRLNSKFADLINFRMVGPLPPYSFATVVVDVLEEEEVEKAKEILGLSARGGLAFGRDGQISKENVKKVYDRLALKLHPDHGGNPVEFEQVTKGYKTLRKFAEQGLVGVHLYQWEES